MYLSRNFTVDIKHCFSCVYIIIAIWIFIQSAFQGRLHISVSTLQLIDWFIWSLLIIESVVIIKISNNVRTYILENWTSLLAIVICFPLFWFHTTTVVYLRFLRFIFFIRLFFPSHTLIKEALLFNRIGTTLLMAIILTVLGGIVMSLFDPSIHTVGDGIWWAWETITTVGYGDEAPSTISGRLLAVVIMIFGAALFSIVTANLSAFIISKHKSSKTETSPTNEILNAINGLKKQIAELEVKIDRNVESNK